MISKVCWRGLAVDIIRRLWDRGLYRDNKTLQQVHDNWIMFWIDYRATGTMRQVDKQIEELNPTPVTIADPVYWEESEGETPLGGTIGFTYEFTDDNT